MPKLHLQQECEKMTITIIEQNTAERREETIKLFQQIQPLLDQGYSYMGALIAIGKVTKKEANGVYSYGWFNDLKEYGATQGYSYFQYRWRKKQ